MQVGPSADTASFVEQNRKQHKYYRTGGRTGMKRRFIKLATVLGILILAAGCTHSLEVTNLDTYINTQMVSLKKPLTVGIVTTADQTDTFRLVKGIASGLGKYSANVVLPYTGTTDRKADIIANIGIKSDYSGSGWNFPINFPGFLIFFPAIHGYVYEANYDIQFGLNKGADNSKIDQWSVPVNLGVRHASINRTWTEVGWLEWGVIPLIGGLAFINYDDKVTPLIVEKIEVPLGDYVAQQIVQRINNAGIIAFSPPEVLPAKADADKLASNPAKQTQEQPTSTK
jgi:hypothetical protein